MQFAKLNGITLHYQIIGAPSGKPLIVFANSLGTDFRIWRDVIVQLVGEFAIVTYDKRGHGLSDTGQYPCSIHDHVDDLAALLDHLGQSEAIICGLSVGGLIAQGLYHKRPDLVRALVLSNTGSRIGTDDLWNERIETTMNEGIGEMADAIMKRWLSRSFHEERVDELAGYQNMLIRQPEIGYAGTCHAIRDADFTSRASDVDVPALCIAGDEDQSTPPASLEALAKAIPDARYELIKGCAHLPCIEKPELMSEMIKAFATTLPATQSAQIGEPMGSA
ncbi:MAG: 3-oxoadipate enol-lactonase [Pseudomonadota bacterium]